MMVGIVRILHHVGSEDQKRSSGMVARGFWQLSPLASPFLIAFNIVSLFCILDNTFISIYQLYIIMGLIITFYILTMIH